MGRRIPCYNCPRRSAICHAQCEDYHNWVAERKKHNHETIEQSEIQNYVIESFIRAGKRKRT